MDCVVIGFLASLVGFAAGAWTIGSTMSRDLREAEQEIDELEDERIICDREGIAAILEATGTRLLECFGPLPQEPTP